MVMNQFNHETFLMQDDSGGGGTRWNTIYQSQMLKVFQ